MTFIELFLAIFLALCAWTITSELFGAAIYLWREKRYKNRLQEALNKGEVPLDIQQPIFFSPEQMIGMPGGPAARVHARGKSSEDTGLYL